MSRAEVAAAYDARAKEYVAKLGTVAQMAAEDRATIGSWGRTTTGRLLDAGCGPGHWTDLLSDSDPPSVPGRRDVIGVDGSPGFLASARRRFPDVPFALADLAALPLATGSVGGVLAWFSLIHTPPAGVPAVLAELARVLSPGGSLLLGFFDGEPGEAFDHTVTTAYSWSADALADLLAAHGLHVEHAGARQNPGHRRQGDLVAQRTPAT